MDSTRIIRAWKDPDYRNSLSADELALLPDNPAGFISLSEEQLREVNGMGPSPIMTTAPTCTMPSWFNWNRCCPKPSSEG